MKKYSVTIKNEEYETYFVDASSKEEAEKLVDSAMDDGSLWDGLREDIDLSSQGRGDYWEVEDGLTEEVRNNE